MNTLMHLRGNGWYKQSSGPGTVHDARNCENCGNGFFARRYPVPGRFCSAACAVHYGASHHAWAGDGVGYAAAHERVYRSRGKATRCDVPGCDTQCQVYDWANLTGQYANPGDYQQMCRSHHNLFDRARKRGDNVSRFLNQ